MLLRDFPLCWWMWLFTLLRICIIKLHVQAQAAEGRGWCIKVASKFPLHRCCLWDRQGWMAAPTTQGCSGAGKMLLGVQPWQGHPGCILHPLLSGWGMVASELLSVAHQLRARAQWDDPAQASKAAPKPDGKWVQSTQGGREHPAGEFEAEEIMEHILRSTLL